jgi:hypothetical protein
MCFISVKFTILSIYFGYFQEQNSWAEPTRITLTQAAMYLPDILWNDVRGSPASTGAYVAAKYIGVTKACACTNKLVYQV